MDGVQDSLTRHFGKSGRCGLTASVVKDPKNNKKLASLSNPHITAIAKRFWRENGDDNSKFDPHFEGTIQGYVVLNPGVNMPEATVCNGPSDRGPETEKRPFVSGKKGLTQVRRVTFPLIRLKLLNYYRICRFY